MRTFSRWGSVSKGFKVTYLTRLKIFLWKPFEFQSVRSVEKIESELSKRIIKEPTFHLLPYYGKLCGKVENGKFTISFQPLSSLFMRGSGELTMHGIIEMQGKGSRIYGRLPGPHPMIWATATVSLGLFAFVLIEYFLSLIGISDLILIWKPLMALSALFFFMTLLIFAFDRGANRQGIEKILSMLKEIAG